MSAAAGAPPDFARVRAGAADPASILADLVAFHTAHPGITEASIGACVTGSGHTGYDILVDQLDPGHLAVADLGCGNGPLLERLARLPHLTRIVGVDACAAEQARVRANDPRLEFVESLDSLEAGSLDAVLSHHAFYLFQPPEAAIASIRRVLRPGGILAWTTTSARGGEHPITVELLTLMSGLVSEAAPHFRGWGDRRQWTPSGRDGLFDGAAWEPLITKDFVLLLNEPPERILGRLADFYYSAWLADRERLLRTWREVLHAGPDGLAVLEWPWACVIARRAIDTPDVWFG